MGSGTMAISFMIPTPFLTSDLLELMDQKARIKMNTEEAIDIIEYVANQLDERFMMKERDLLISAVEALKIETEKEDQEFIDILMDIDFSEVSVSYLSRLLFDLDYRGKPVANGSIVIEWYAEGIPYLTLVELNDMLFEALVERKYLDQYRNILLKHSLIFSGSKKSMVRIIIEEE